MSDYPNPAECAGAPLLALRNLGVHLHGKSIVQGVDLDIAHGQRLALVGESGSGKTLTALSVLGLVPAAHATGQALWCGTENLLQATPQRQRQLRGSEVAMIFQEPMTALNPLMRVGAQVAEVLALKQGLPRRAAWAQALQLLAQTGLEPAAERAQQWPHQLSGGQRQRVMIAAALASRPRLLIADEPTTALDASRRLQMLELLGQLQAQTGMAVLLITHDLHLVRHFAQHVAVMQHGRIVEQGAVDAVFAAPIHAYTRTLLASRRLWSAAQPQPLPKSPNEVSGVCAQHLPESAPMDTAAAEAAPTSRPSEQPLITAADLGVCYERVAHGLRGWWRKKEQWSALRDVCLQLHAGRTLGVVGESGSGKSTLAAAILGLLPIHEGHLRILGQSWQMPCTRNTPHNRALRRSVQVVFQDPFSSLSPRLRVRELVGEGLRVHEPHLSEAEHHSRIVQTLATVGLEEGAFPGLLTRYAHEFSGGQRQRLAIARALIVRPRVLVLDEPTSALDARTQQQVLNLLAQLQAQQGLAYVLITHDLDVVAAIAHDVLVLQDGQVVESGPAQQLLSQPQHPYTQALLQAARL